jgi:hypothetical protein
MKTVIMEFGMIGLGFMFMFLMWLGGIIWNALTRTHDIVTSTKMYAVSREYQERSVAAAKEYMASKKKEEEFNRKMKEKMGVA